MSDMRASGSVDFDTVCIIDNGSGYIKAGYRHSQEPLLIPNAVAKRSKHAQYASNLKDDFLLSFLFFLDLFVCLLGFVFLMCVWEFGK